MNTETTTPDQTTELPALDAETSEQPQEQAAETEAPEREQQDDDAGKGKRSEAQKLRGRLRDAEAERDQALAAVDGLRRGMIEQHMTGSRSHVSTEALWAAGHTASEFFTPEGQLDAPALQQAITATADRFAIKVSNPNPAMGRGQDQSNVMGTNKWEQAFR